jgi:hypothetical protein
MQLRVRRMVRTAGTVLRGPDVQSCCALSRRCNQDGAAFTKYAAIANDKVRIHVNQLNR